MHISGFIAWLSWLFIHIFFLIGFRNRVVVLFQWAWSYLTYERSARLITGESRVIAVPSMQYEERAVERAEGLSSAGEVPHSGTQVPQSKSELPRSGSEVLPSGSPIRKVG